MEEGSNRQNFCHSQMLQLRNQTGANFHEGEIQLAADLGLTFPRDDHRSIDRG